MSEIAIYNEFNSQLAELKELNDKTVFDYADKKGNKEARSHIGKLKKTKSAIESARKSAKAESLAYGRKVDSEAKELVNEVQIMIDIHKAPLDEIEQIEFEKLNKIAMKLLDLCNLEYKYNGESSASIKDQIEWLSNIVIGDEYDDRRAEAIIQKDISMNSLKKALDIAVSVEEKQAEFERLKKEEDERKQKERDERLVNEAKAQAEREAETKAQAVKKAAEDKEVERARQEKAREQEAVNRELELKLSNERAENEKQEAILRAERAEADAKLKAENDLAEAKRLEEAETKAREANRKHVSNVRRIAKEAFMAVFDEETSVKIVKMIGTNKIPNVTINY